ncbi:MAG: 50S ribosomal protein L18, partial [Patescibacteria group bacterium]|nr:50S ribosomal protein L18 [Patescibacteria group bacterium]
MKNAIQEKNKKFERRRMRVRAKISGTAERPRLSVFKSHRYIYAQLIDDVKGNTLVSFDSKKIKAATPADRAKEVGLGLAKKALAAKIKKAVFDKAGYLYTGKIKLVWPL